MIEEKLVRHQPDAFNQPGGFIYRSMRVFVLRSVLACLQEQFLFRPQDVANAVTFLASPRASYITGTVMLVDGVMRRHSF